MENKIKETTEQLKNGTITKDEADKILLGLFGVITSSKRRIIPNVSIEETELLIDGVMPKN